MNQDVVSFNVEQARGDIHNLVIVLMNEQNLSVQEAMDYVGVWYDARGKAFVSAMNSLPSPQKDCEDLKRYIWGLGNWVTANYEWSFDSMRFFKTREEQEEVRKNRTVELMEKVMIPISV